MRSAYGATLSLCFLRELHEIGLARHGAVVLHDLADDAGGLEPGEAGEIDRAFGLTGSHQARRRRAPAEEIYGRA